MNKEKRYAFGKDIYLLGVDSEGTKYWLEAPSWDCDWYWGFGYVQTYEYKTIKNLKDYQIPENAADICSHQHIEKFYKKWWDNSKDSKSILTQVPFTEKEGWELAELFNQFYFLKEAAEMFNRGKAHIANTKINTWKKSDLVKEINEELIPMVTGRILEILNPIK